MSADLTTRGATAAPSARRGTAQRLSTETRKSYKTSEFWIYLLASAGILIAGLVTEAGDGRDDRLLANQVWLYFAIVTAGYLLSRGLAKSGSREPFFRDGSNAERSDGEK